MIAGIFVGGASSRMRGQPKGRLLARDTGEPLVVRSARLSRLAGLVPVLVGEARAYDDLLLDVPRVADAPAGVGPLGGLSGLFAFAQRSLPAPLPGGEGAARVLHVLVLACDMPFISSDLLAKLARAPAGEDVLAPRGMGGFWEPLCARYCVARCAPSVRAALAAQERSFQALFRRLSVRELALSERERRELQDWDAPEDVEDEP